MNLQTHKFSLISKFHFETTIVQDYVKVYNNIIYAVILYRKTIKINIFYSDFAEQKYSSSGHYIIIYGKKKK